MKQKPIYDSLIIGAGPIGLAMARALQLRGLSVCLCGQLPQSSQNSPDLRTAALFAGSVRLLERLSAWPHLVEVAAPLTAIRIVDATGHLLRAPEQMFAATDIGEPQLGFNVPNPALTEALRQTLAPGAGPADAAVHDINLHAEVTRVTIENHPEVEPNGGHVTALLADGTARRGRIAIAADGRHSLTRAAAGIETTTWHHEQAAITAHFEHALPHGGISTEIHTRTGPCTVVPLTSRDGRNRSSLVWMDRPDAAKARANLSDGAFISALEDQLAGLLGPVRSVTPRRVFPLSSMIAQRFAASRVALVGESGHAFPPIGAQGLNLGLRDVASLADHLADARRAGQDIGSDTVLAAYSSERRADITARTYGVDAFNQSLANRAAGLVRGAVLHATQASPGIKRFLMERGMQPVGDWPTLMCPQARKHP